MLVQMTDSRMGNNLADIENFLKATDKVSFKVNGRRETYQWVEETLVKFGYALAKKKNRGIIKRYIRKMTGYSRAQVTRLISQYIETGRIKVSSVAKHTFKKVYGRKDITLLAKTDELHDYPNGAALKKILERMVKVYKIMEYQNIANISVAQIYNLRHTVLYERLTKKYIGTKPTVSNIGERRKPDPQGKPGYLRVDTVHQGDEKDLKGGYVKGVYHINIIDEVTQFEFIGAAEKISERFLLPILEELIDSFPFVIIEFHADNGSEYINYLVVDLLNRLVIKLTKSRSRKSNDNALVEGKNGSVIRKWIGYSFIEQKYADQINEFYFNCFNEYLNYHRPCAYATKITDQKGKVKKIYKPQDYMTPYDKLKSLPGCTKYLKPGISFDTMNEIALKRNDNDMAKQVQEERRKLFDTILPVNL